MLEGPTFCDLPLPGWQQDKSSWRWTGRTGDIVDNVLALCFCACPSRSVRWCRSCYSLPGPLAMVMGMVTAMRVTTVHAEGDVHRQLQPQRRKRRSYRELRRHHLCPQGGLQEVSESRRRYPQSQKDRCELCCPFGLFVHRHGRCVHAGRFIRRSPEAVTVFHRAGAVSECCCCVPRE